MTRISMLTPDDPEWQHAWNAFPDKAMACDGEVLQYMGTIALPHDGWACMGHYVHLFRHRCAPCTHQRQTWNIPCTPGWHPRDPRTDAPWR